VVRLGRRQGGLRALLALHAGLRVPADLDLLAIARRHDQFPRV
jgi:hypothetical protein